MSESALVKLRDRIQNIRELVFMPLAEAVALANELTALHGRPAEPAPCGWERQTEPDGDFFWESGCGEAYNFSSGDWRENNYRFCPGCGGKIIQADVPVEEFGR